MPVTRSTILFAALTAAIAVSAACAAPRPAAPSEPLTASAPAAGTLPGAAPGAGPVLDTTLEARVRRVETGLVTLNVVRGETARLTIDERLRFYDVPGVSVAVVDGGRIAWARAWGVADAATGAHVDTATLFQAASISKPVAAVGALRMVEEGRLELDGDVNHRLRRWQVPESRHTAVEKVTLRRLLSHSAGTTVHGFPGYPAGAPVPTLVQILDGQPPANTAPVRVDTIPGSLWRYSGGGTTVVQLLMEDVSGRPFAELMETLVLRPAGMTHSTFAQPIPADHPGVPATAHRSDGSPIPGGHHTYPEQAAAGLWTTPSDLARFALHVREASAGAAGRVLSPGMARRMLTVEAGAYGLGFALSGEADDRTFGHGGSNAGFQSILVLHSGDGPGAVVMTNGQNGINLAYEIVRAIAREYGLPGHEPTVRDAVALDRAALADLAGDYYDADDDPPAAPRLRVRLDDDGVLRADVPRVGWTGRTLRPQSETRFFFLENAGALEFERGPDGRAVAVVVTELGPPARLVRR
jgi:CubicO group peptidase (beta-lactamase class C family)